MAVSTGHTFSTSCMFHQASNEFTRRASVASIDPPRISAQFFYCSDLPIDDPLSPIPPPSSNPANKHPRVPPRPFSVHDNRVLEKTWRALHTPVRSKVDTPGSVPDTTDVALTQQEHIAHVVKDAQGKQIDGPVKTNSQGFEAVDPAPETRNDVFNKALGNTTPPAGLGNEHRPASPDLTLCDDPEHIPFDDTMPITSEEIGNDEFESGVAKKRRSWSPFRHKEKIARPKDRDDTVTNEPPSPAKQDASDANFSSSLPARDTSGTPFLRIPSRIRRSRSRSPEYSQSAPGPNQADGAQSPIDHHPKNSSPLRPTFQRSDSSQSNNEAEGGSTLDAGSRRHSLRTNQPKVEEPEEAHVAVGMLRLHTVHMPILKVRCLSCFEVPENADSIETDGAHLLGSCPRHLLRYSWDLVLQRLNDAYRV